MTPLRGSILHAETHNSRRHREQHAPFWWRREDASGVPGHHSTKGPCDLDAWISRAQASLVAAFANGVSKDKAAIEAAIALPWSNGQTEGQICKLKLVKRQMSASGNIDLLQARIIGLG